MVLSHGNTHSQTAKMEQIITQFFAKSLHIILESRALSVSLRNSYGGGDKPESSPRSFSSPSPSVRRRDKWFNLALRECPSALVNINNLECLIIDVILVHKSQDLDPMAPKRVLLKRSSLKERYPLYYHGEELGVEAKSEKIVERWVVQYENRKIKDSNSGTRRSSNFSLRNLYKKLTAILRSLYAKVRLLPAYEIFNDLSSSTKIRSFTLAHRVSSFVEPFTLKEENEMMKYRFTPVDTSSGRLCLKVMYCPSAANLVGNQLHSLFRRVIPDYVGSSLADPLRKLPPRAPRRHSSNFDDSESLAPSIQKNGASIDDGCKPSPSPSIYHTCSSSSITPKAVNSSGYTDSCTNVMQSGATDEKVFSLGKDEPRKYSGVGISANSLRRISISSRSYRDDFDATDFSCPFDVGYDDMKDPESRKFNDAAIGKLVDRLKKARHVHQDFYTSEHSYVSRKTTSDALEEYDDYLEMKNYLVSKTTIHTYT